MISSSSNHQQQRGKTTKQQCSFCEKQIAVVSVCPSGGLVDRPLCLEHYYTTRNVRPGKITSSTRPKDQNNSKSTNSHTNSSHNNNFKVFQNSTHAEEINRQLSDMQQIFAEAYVELQKDISETLAQEAASDPLDALFQKKKSRSRRKNVIIDSNKFKQKAPAIYSEKFQRKGGGHNYSSTRNTMEMEEKTSGGFFRESEQVRALVEAQQQRNSQQKVYNNRDTADTQIKASAVKDSEYNPYKRRKPNKKSYWSVGGENSAAESSSQQDMGKSDDVALKVHVPRCSCGSDDVEYDGTLVGRNSDMAKGETWGNKDRDEVVERYRCLRCGKVWDEV